MTQQRGSAPDPIGDLQRWLVRSGARGMSKELSGHLAGMFGIGGKSGDVWETATAPPPTEAPECAWCPVCRAARLLRESGPGLASHMASASDTLATVVQEATTVVESVLAAAGRRAGAAQADGESSAGQAAATPAWDTATAPGAEWDPEPGSAWEQAIQEDGTIQANGSPARGTGGEAAGPVAPPVE